jgi:hypothetical protein
MEDVELRERLWRNGAEITFLREAAVVHPLRRLGTWSSIRRRAEAHGICVRLEKTHMAPFTGREVVVRFARTWRRSILPQIWRYRGRGFWRRAQYSLMAFVCYWEMRRAIRRPRLPEWKPALAAERGGR